MGGRGSRRGEVGKGMSPFMRIVSYSQGIYYYLLSTDTKGLRPHDLPKSIKLVRGSNSVCSPGPGPFPTQLP